MQFVSLGTNIYRVISGFPGLPGSVKTETKISGNISAKKLSKSVHTC